MKYIIINAFDNAMVNCQNCLHKTKTVKWIRIYSWDRGHILYFKIKMFCFLEDQSQTTYMIKVQTRLVPLHNDSWLRACLWHYLDINQLQLCCLGRGVGWAHRPQTSAGITAAVSHDIKLGSDWTDVHWRVLGKHKQLGAFCWEKWSYLNVWYRNKKNISEGEC